MKAKFIANIKSVANALALVCAAVLPVSADVITVTNTNDSGPGSLRNALAIANDGDEIIFEVTGSIGLTSGELVVNDSITISGPGADNLAVDGNATNRVFHVGSGRTAVISGLTITNGRTSGDAYPDDSGGGIYNDHATLSLSSCTVSNNSALTFGGGIYNDHGSLMVNGCALSGNFSGNTGGALYSDGSSGSAFAVINSTTFAKNSCYAGGAIYSDGESGTATLEVSNSVISGNSTILFGGGIVNISGGMGGSAMLQISNSTISNNSADSEGGGIYSSDGFSPDSTANLIISNSTLSANSAANNGGGIYSLGASGVANANISDSTVSENAAGNEGGGIYNSGIMATLHLDNSSIVDNSAQTSGGGIYNMGFLGTGGGSYLANTIFQAGTSGGTIFNDSGTITSVGYNMSSDNGGGYLNGPGDQINTDPMLGPLQDNGGPTFTHELLPGSPAINAGDPSFTPPPFYDQRGPGFYRVRNGRLDIGSFEVQAGATPTPTPRPTPTRRPRPTPAPRP